MASPMRARLGEDRYGSVTRRVVFGMPNTGLPYARSADGQESGTWSRVG
jgi:hypothetical protein